ncbi:MAG: hypothetical protein CMF70_06695 [Magnetovibrio sp.]|nr:hypothetical protein [Magnetovibrio sp.]
MPARPHGHRVVRVLHGFGGRGAADQPLDRVVHGAPHARRNRLPPTDRRARGVRRVGGRNDLHASQDLWQVVLGMAQRRRHPRARGRDPPLLRRAGPGQGAVFKVGDGPRVDAVSPADRRTHVVLFRIVRCGHASSGSPCRRGRVRDDAVGPVDHAHVAWGVRGRVALAGAPHFQGRRAAVQARVVRRLGALAVGRGAAKGVDFPGSFAGGDRRHQRILLLGHRVEQAIDGKHAVGFVGGGSPLFRGDDERPHQTVPPLRQARLREHEATPVLFDRAVQIRQEGRVAFDHHDVGRCVRRFRRVPRQLDAGEHVPCPPETTCPSIL